MKKLFVLIFVLGTILKGYSQITLEQQYIVAGNKLFYITDIGNNDYKYVIMDTSGFSMYNLDHSPYLLNFVPPVPLGQPPSYYEVAYISKSLFDCVSTTLEYVLENGNYPANFYIYRTDGTLLFEGDTVTGPYGIGLLDGSLYQKPIVNTPDGAKLFLFGRDVDGHPDTMSVYSLCGTLPESVSEIPLDNSYVQVFPNPANAIVNFQINPPNNQEKFKLTIYNSLFQKVDEAIILGKDYQLDLRKKPLSSGTYLFDLKTEEKVFQIGKFIISK
jgi:hypothetical protein